MKNIEKDFINLLEKDNIDELMYFQQRDTYNDFINDLEKELNLAYGLNDSEAHLAMQKILYRINRLKLFWCDDLNNYKNESSMFINDIRNKIEKSWQEWELSQLPVQEISEIKDVKKHIFEMCEKDLNDKSAAPHQKYLSDEMDLDGYKKVLEIFSIDALAEASWLAWSLGGQVSQTQLTLSRIFIEEYGNGKLQFKHSTYFKNMLEELNLNTEPEYYLDSVTWEFLATVNHFFMMANWKKLYLRFVGSFLYMELNTPNAFYFYDKGTQRLGVNNVGKTYWNVHIVEDKRHGEWMLNEAALPMIEAYPDLAYEIILGYEQQRKISSRSGKSIAEAAKKASKVKEVHLV